MCGIAGLYTSTQTAQPVSHMVQAMTQALAHRGPDDEGYLLLTAKGLVPALGKDSARDVKARGGFADIMSGNTDSQLVLGHRRLSIIDLSADGHQPMIYGDDLAIVFNGEIYNYVELREELIKAGFQFRTHTDTEVLLAAWQHWGETFVNQLKGMWALVIYDHKQRKLFGSRDRFGVKPLYYAHTEGQYFAFASEQKALLQLPLVKTRLSRAAAFDYLVNGNLEREAKGLFTEIIELLPGCNFQYDLQNGNLKIWHYFNLAYKPNVGEFDEDKFKTYSRKVRKMLIANLKLRLRADVPVSVLLSGGIDSSAVACLADHIANDSPATFSQQKNLFSVTFPGSKYDETRFARLVVDKIGGNWHQLTPTSQQLLDDFQDLVYTNDIPFTGLAAYSQYALFRHVASQGIKVALDGQGADELFSGYAAHFRVFMGELLDSGQYGAFMANFSTANNSFAGKGDLLAHFLKRAYISLIRSQKGGRPIKQSTHPEYSYLRTEFWEGHRKKIDLDLPTTLNGMLHKHYTGTVLKGLLRCGDRNSMRFGVECRTPFADDHELATYVFNIQSIYKIRYGQSKILLRSALGDTLPTPILNRRDKMGFATPQTQFIKALRGQWLDFFDNQSRDIIDVKSIHKDWKKLSANGGDGDGSRLWRLINLAAWRQVYKV